MNIIPDTWNESSLQYTNKLIRVGFCVVDLMAQATASWRSRYKQEKFFLAFTQQPMKTPQTKLLVKRETVIR